MGYAYKYNKSDNLLVVRIWGEMSYSEEADAVSSVFGSENVSPGVKILVDRTEAKFTSDSNDVREHVRLVSQEVAELGQPIVANVVSADFDFGMIRMFEAMAEDKIDHTFRVFRSIAEACEWLGVDEESIEWPKRKSDELL